MSTKKYDWFNVESQSRSEWEGLCPVGEFRIVDPSRLPSILPNDLTNKYDSVFIMASGSENGVVYYMANGNRVDYHANAIDQQPFGLAFIGDYPVPSGSLIQHGDWANRTIHPPEDFWRHLALSGIGTVYPISELPPTNSGLLSDINVSSQQDAFNDMVNKIRSTFLNNKEQ
jgi:hypothetical protein